MLAFLSVRRTADGSLLYFPAAGEWSFERLSSSEAPPRPKWLDELIDHIAAGPALNPPRAMANYRCEHRGQTAYLRPSHCDVPSVLYRLLAHVYGDLDRSACRIGKVSRRFAASNDSIPLITPQIPDAASHARPTDVRRFS